MTGRAGLSCGCSYIKAGGRWYQVVACPEHVMDLKPHADVPGTGEGA